MQSMYHILDMEAKATITIATKQQNWWWVGMGKRESTFPRGAAKHLQVCVSMSCCSIKCLFAHLSSCFSGDPSEGRDCLPPKSISPALVQRAEHS